MIVIAGAALITLGVAYAVLSVAQFMGHTWFVLRKPVVQPSEQKLRAGGIVGLVIAAVAVLLGVSWMRGPVVGGNVGRGIWLAFMASCVIATVGAQDSASRWQRVVPTVVAHLPAASRSGRVGRRLRLERRSRTRPIGLLLLLSLPQMVDGAEN